MSQAYDQWLQLDLAGMSNVESGSLETAKQMGEALLALAPTYPTSWYYGNAIHKGHLILGRIALRQGDRHQAIEHLLAAGQTPGSPQLDTFGPNMTLAKELLEVGERGAVLAFIRLCQNFWAREFAQDSSDLWCEQIEHGEVPDFGAHLYY